VQSRTARCAFQAVSNASYRSTGGHHSRFRPAGPIPKRRPPLVAAGVRRRAGSISHHRCARFRTQRL